MLLDATPSALDIAHDRWLSVVLIIGFAFLWPPATSRAQVAAPNKLGVAMGHLHFHVRDVRTHTKFWTTLGATPTKIGTADVMKFPDVLIFLTTAESSGGTEGSTVNHVGFKVPDLAATLAKLKAAGYQVEEDPSTWRARPNANTFTPDHDRIELFQEGTELAKFDVDKGQDPGAALRLNQKMTVPINTHHLHLYSPDATDAQVKAWYVTTFGAVPGRRGEHYEAADLPGINLNFCSSGCGHSPGVSLKVETAAMLAPTKGRTLDHIGFEVTNLREFCQKLEMRGVKFDVPYSGDSSGVVSAMFTDPWGTSIELTEGLNRF